MLPCAVAAISCSALSSAVSPSFKASFSRAMISCSAILPKSKRWQRERMVAGSFCGSVVARMNTMYSGGSSSVLSRALKAALDSMWTSSMMYTL